MNGPRILALLLALSCAAPHVHAQDTLPVPLPCTSRPWAMNASVLGFLYTDTTALFNPSFTADRGKLHLEARYQWEDWRTGSLWAGYNISFGNELAVSFTPMAGLVFGLVNGAAPGYMIEAEWRSLSFYSSSEYVLDFADSGNNFAYTWNELSVDLDHLLIGIVLQRLRPFQSELDLQKGLLLMREQGNFLFGMYLFNAFWETPTVVLNLAYTFEAGRPRP